MHKLVCCTLLYINTGASNICVVCSPQVILCPIVKKVHSKVFNVVYCCRNSSCIKFIVPEGAVVAVHVLIAQGRLLRTLHSCQILVILTIFQIWRYNHHSCTEVRSGAWSDLEHMGTFFSSTTTKTAIEASWDRVARFICILSYCGQQLNLLLYHACRQIYRLLSNVQARQTELAYILLGLLSLLWKFGVVM